MFVKLHINICFQTQINTNCAVDTVNTRRSLFVQALRLVAPPLPRTTIRRYSIPCCVETIAGGPRSKCRAAAVEASVVFPSVGATSMGAGEVVRRN